MYSNGYSKSCPKMIRKFYDDFDLLPLEAKALIWEGNYPTFDDLKLAWELVQEDGSIKNVIDKYSLHSFEREKKLRDKQEADRKREEAKRAKEDARWKRKAWGRRPIYETRVIDHRNDKHGTLIARISEEQAFALLAKRKERADVKVVPRFTVYQELVGWEKASKPVKEEPKYFDFDNVPQTLGRIMHNAGGGK